jgi:protease I
VQRVLVLTGDAAEELDVMYPVYRLREAGYAVDVAALSRRPVQLVIHDFDPESDAYTEKNGRKLPVDVTFAEVDPSAYAALVIPGGRAPEYIRTDAHVRRITEHFFKNDLPVGTICHGPQVPAVYGLLRGRTTAAFPPLTGDMENAGATVVDAPDVVDRNMCPAAAGRTSPSGRAPSWACSTARPCPPDLERPCSPSPHRRLSRRSPSSP